MADQIIVSIHIICGAVLFMFSGVMQLVVGPVMAKFSPGEEKKAAQRTLQKRAQSVMNVAILIMTATALYLFHSRWSLISESSWLALKVVFGTIALLLANILHFIIRFKRMRLQESSLPEDQKKLDALKKKVWFLEKIVLTGATLAFIMGVLFNHV